MASKQRAPSSTKKSEPGALAKGYLLLYNGLQFTGWSYLLYQLVGHYVTGNDLSTLWPVVRPTLMLFQNAAVLEVLHTMTGLVKSNTLVTAMQVASRVMVTCGVLAVTPTAPLSPGLPLLLTAWSVTEIIRYLFYALNILSNVPYSLIWCRYTFFYLLYPIGVTGELLCLYAAQEYVRTSKLFSFELPNSLNATFSYRYLLIGIMAVYLPFFPKLYLYMVSQRKKVIGGSGTGRKEE